MIKTCEHCGKEFETRKKYQKYCSKECCAKSRKLNRIYICENCGKEFHPKKRTIRFCCPSCAKKARIKTYNHICEYCGTTFKSKEKKRKYCNKSCSLKAQTKYKTSNGKKYKEKLYVVWNGIKNRCYNSKDNFYQGYGGRGIIICDKWLNFDEFYEWGINNGYQEGLSIERINVNGNYEPSNCKWIKMEEQAKNKRNNIRIIYNGQEMILKDIARREGVNYKYLWAVYKRLKDIYKALDRVHNYSRKNKMQ